MLGSTKIGLLCALLAGCAFARQPDAPDAGELDRRGDASIADLAAPSDLASAADLAAAHDLASAHDLATPRDLATPPDLTQVKSVLGGPCTTSAQCPGAICFILQFTGCCQSDNTCGAIDIDGTCQSESSLDSEYAPPSCVSR